MLQNSPITLTLSPSSDGNTWSLAVAQPNGNGQEPKYRLELDAPSGLYRAVALRPIYNAHGGRVAAAGDRSGLLWGDGALSPHGGCWVRPDARVLTNARVSGDALVTDRATIETGAHIRGCAIVSGDARISDAALVAVEARVYGRAHVSAYAQVLGNATVEGSVVVRGEVYINGGQFYENVKLDAADTLHIEGGCWQGDMAVRKPTDFLQINTRWGIMTVARAAGGGWIGSVGCQRFDTFSRLLNMARDYDADYEIDLLQSWFAMLRRAFEQWGLNASIIEGTTAVPAGAWASDGE